MRKILKHWWAKATLGLTLAFALALTASVPAEALVYQWRRAPYCYQPLVSKAWMTNYHPSAKADFTVWTLDGKYLATLTVAPGRTTKYYNSYRRQVEYVFNADSLNVTFDAYCQAP